MKGEGQIKTMKRRTKEGVQNPRYSRPPAMDVTSTTSAISECIQEFLEMQHSILRMDEYFFLYRSDEPLDKEQQEVLHDKKSNVDRLIKTIFKETNEGDQNPSSSYLPPAETALTAISEIIQGLLKMQCGILQREHSRSQGVSLDKEEVLYIKSTIVNRLEKLFKETEEDAVIPMETETDPAACGSRVLVSRPVQEKESRWQEEFTWSSMDGSKEIEEKERYLCLSNGFEIWCLDLAKSKRNAADLPKIDTLDLVGGPLPASVGLFKLGADAYMIGGQELPASLSDSVHALGWAEKYQGVGLYHSLCKSHVVKGTSCHTYRLSLAADEDGTLRLSRKPAVYIKELKKPKVWPVVEMIDEKLHVIDSVPRGLMVGRYWIFSHECGNLEDDDDDESGGCVGGWEEILPTIKETDQITSHAVVGNRIYAVTNAGSEEYYFMGFDSQTRKWEGCSSAQTIMDCGSAVDVKHVCNILNLGIGRCAGEYKYTKKDVNLYVLVAIVRDYRLCTDAGVGTRAVAYLVTLTGEVVCYQILPDFFKEPLLPYDMEAGIMIHVEDNEGEEDRTMCSIVSGTLAQQEEGRKREYLFINTFSVEVLDDAQDKVEQLLAKKAAAAAGGSAVVVEEKFVSFTRKGWYIYETDATLKMRIVGWRACFLTPSS